MKNTFKRGLSVILATIIIFGSTLVGFDKIDLDVFSVKAEAAEIESLTPDNEMCISWNSGEKFIYVAVEESGFYDISIDSAYHYYSKISCVISNDDIRYYVGPVSDDYYIKGLPYNYRNMYFESGKQYILSIECFDEYDMSCYGEITLLLTQNDYNIKKISSSSTTIISDENEMQWFRIKTNAAGEYAIFFNEDVFCYIYDVETGKLRSCCWYPISTVTLEANKEYILAICFYNENPKPHYVSFEKQEKTVKKVELYNAECNPDFFDEEYFCYKVTYTDGTVEIVDYSFFENRGVIFYVWYDGEYDDEYYMKVGEQPVQIIYNDIETFSYINVISFLEYFSYLDIVYPDETMRITYEDTSEKEYFWHIKIKETGKYILNYYGDWENTFDGWYFRIYDKNNDIVSYENGWSLEEGEEYCFAFRYKYDEYASWDFRFFIKSDESHVHQYKSSVCKECGYWKNKTTAPKLSAISNSTSGVTVSWNVLEGAEGYNVYRKTGSSGWELITVVEDGSKTSYIDRTANSGTTYTYTVRGYKGNGLSSFNKSGISIKYLSTPKITSIANVSSGVTVKWEKVSGANGYYVYRKTGNGNWTKVATIKSNGTVSYTDKTAKAGVIYKYTVKAYSGSYTSSNKASGDFKRLSTPKITSLSNTTSGVTVKWGKAAGASGYYVYRKTTGGWTKIATVKGAGTVSYTDKTAKAGVTYKYTVKAYYGSFTSSNQTSSDFRRLTTPTLKSVTSAKSGITFKWNKVTGATGYYVYRKTGNGSWVKLATVTGNSKITYLDKTAKKGVTYKYTVKAYYGTSTSYYNTKGLTIKDKY